MPKTVGVMLPAACASADRDAGSRGARLPAALVPQRSGGARNRSPWPSAAPRRIVRRGQWIIHRQLPAGAVIGDYEAVGDLQMPAEHLRAKPAFEANDVILLDRASDRNCRPRRLLHRWGTPETGKGAMHLDNQSGELVSRDLVMPH